MRKPQDAQVIGSGCIRRFAAGRRDQVIQVHRKDAGNPAQDCQAPFALSSLLIAQRGWARANPRRERAERQPTVLAPDADRHAGTGDRPRERKGRQHSRATGPQYVANLDSARYSAAFTTSGLPKLSVL